MHASLAAVVARNTTTIEFEFTQPQLDFYKYPARFKVLAKGRRWGATISATKYIIKQMLTHMSDKEPYLVLWVDVIYSNISRYYSRYFAPILGGLAPGQWSWKDQQKQLTIGSSVLDLRSADRRESLEGFAYNLIFLNEAGLILQDRDLWSISIAPMALDHNADCIFAGTPKGIIDKHDQKREALFFELYKKGLETQQSLWKSFNYSTFDNPFMSNEQVQEMANEIPPMIQQQEIYGKFINVAEEPVFYEAWFPIIDRLPDAGIVYKIISMDTAFKAKEESDYSCALVIYQTPTHYIIVDCLNEKYEFPELQKATQALYDRYHVDVVLVEDRASGQSLIQSLKAETTIPVHAISPDKDKFTRAVASTPVCQAGKVQLLKGSWNKSFLLQMTNFPCGHDDIVDSWSQAAAYLRDWRGNNQVFRTYKLKDKVIPGINRMPITDRMAGFSSPLHLQDTMRGYR
jgi:phage uncharacterized protein (putative large terminase), C-terminal domain